jgi:hypothetical protein
MIQIKKITQWGAIVWIDGKKYQIREGDTIVDGNLVRYCSFCGRPFDEEEYKKTMCEQSEGRRCDCYVHMGATKHCGLYCAYLGEKVWNYGTHFPEDKQEKMKDDIAKRVAKYLKEKGVKK